jgi:archaemetzincin
MAALLSRDWAKGVATSGFDESLIQDIGIPVQPAAEPEWAMDADGRFRAECMVRSFAPRAPETCTLVLTGRDLSAGNRSWVFGYADRRRAVAVVSTCRICVPGDPQVTARRLRGVIAHELGHLRGLAHCPTPGCVMHAARNPAELDSRRDRPCGRCPSHLQPLRLACAVAACALLFLCLDWVGEAVKPGRMSSPFSVRSARAGQPVQVLFAGKPAIELARQSPGLSDLQTRLNAAYRDLLAARFEIETLPSGSALIRLNGAGLLLVTAAEAGAGPPAELAHQWSLRLAEAVDGKGSARESCPECHIARHSEVLAWAQSHGRR